MHEPADTTRITSRTMEQGNGIIIKHVSDAKQKGQTEKREVSLPSSVAWPYRNIHGKNPRATAPLEDAPWQAYGVETEARIPEKSRPTVLL